MSRWSEVGYKTRDITVKKNEFSAGSKQIQMPLAQSSILTTQDASQPALWGGSLGGRHAIPWEELH